MHKHCTRQLTASGAANSLATLLLCGIMCIDVYCCYADIYIVTGSKVA
jgi:hypothetical protein